MHYYDTRQEIGENGFIRDPIRFYRDDLYYENVWFLNASTAELNALDIFFAIDVTRDLLPGEVEDTTFNSVWNDVLERFDITFDVTVISVEHAKSRKSVECEFHSNTLRDNAYANPTSGVFVDSEFQKKKVDVRVRDKANKQAGEILLTQIEKDEAKTDQKLSEYEGKCLDATDKAIKEVDKGTDALVIMAMDVSTLTIWPVWTPPV